MELFNKALFLSQQKISAFTHRRVYTLMVNLFQILNQFVLLFRKNVIEKSFMIWRVLPLVKINTRISETPCMLFGTKMVLCALAGLSASLRSTAIYQPQHIKLHFCSS
jgi:ABC-type taurine transport system ATPase subunit